MFNNNNNNNKEEHIHTLLDSPYNPSHKTATASALTIQNHHVPSSPQIRLKGADVSIGNQFNQPATYKGYQFENQDLTGLEFTEYVPTTILDNESFKFEASNEKPSNYQLVEDVYQTLEKVPDVKLKITEKPAGIETTKKLSSYLTSQQSVPKSSVRFESSNKALGVQTTTHLPRIPAKFTTIQGSSKQQKPFESLPSSTDNVISGSNQFSYDGQKSNGVSTFRPSQSYVAKLYSGSYQYPIPSIQPNKLYTGSSDQSSALWTAYKKQQMTQTNQVLPQTYSTTVRNYNLYSSYKPVESHVSSLNSYNQRPYYSYAKTQSSYSPKATVQSSFVTSPSTSFNYGNQYYAPSSKIHQIPKLLSNTRDETETSSLVASVGQKQLSYDFVPSYKTWNEGTSKYF